MGIGNWALGIGELGIGELGVTLSPPAGGVGGLEGLGVGGIGELENRELAQRQTQDGNWELET